ncbi:MAG TPA: DUF6544 family protein [Vicinamibacterales bacterium]|jgi:hypothetical protein|nr:DUF6544 family protein [Vicinamibacterales bacterium]
MWWAALWVLVIAIGAVGFVASANSVRFAHRVTREAEALLAQAETGPTVDDRLSSGLPLPVRRYLSKAVPSRERGVRTVRLRHGGSFRPSLDGSWLPIRGEQYFATSPPGFIWWGRVRMGPGMWIDARDRSLAGSGNMLVSLESTVTLADSKGPQLDQGALLRLLGEMAWFPTALLDERYVRWSPIDDRRARALLTVNGREVSGVFAFGPDDLPTTFSAERYRDVGKGQAILTPFEGQSSDFREVAGMLVPYSMVAAWRIDGRLIEYVRWSVERIEYDVDAPF